jgi:uncharacterized protein
MKPLTPIFAVLALLALAACDRAGDGKTDASSSQRLSAALDVCAEGRGAFAGHVCGDEQLSALNEQVSEALVAEAAEVSDAGAQMLVQNQNRWLEAQRIACGIVDPDAAPTPEQQACLQSELRARVEDAREAVQDVGGYTFQRMELVDATPVTAEVAEASGLGDAAPRAITREIRFPRIDGQQTPAIQRFNELVAQEPQFRLEDATSEVVDYRIAYAGQELISVRFDLSSDTLGAAHPNNTSKAVTVLMTEGRALTEADVFTANSGWQRFLTERAVREIARQYREDGFEPPERDVQETATKAHLWLITERGLTMLFPPYSFGAPYVMGGTEVTVPWAELRPYLNPAAPAPIRPAA